VPFDLVSNAKGLFGTDSHTGWHIAFRSFWVYNYEWDQDCLALHMGSHKVLDSPSSSRDVIWVWRQRRKVNSRRWNGLPC